MADSPPCENLSWRKPPINWKFWEHKAKAVTEPTPLPEGSEPAKPQPYDLTPAPPPADHDPKVVFKNKTGPKFTTDEALGIVMQIAQYQTAPEVKAFVKENYGKDMTLRTFYDFKKSEKWKGLIEKYRLEYEQALVEVPLASKRKRLDELQKLYEKAILREKYTSAQSIIRDCRDEVEVGKNFSGSNFYITQVNEFQSLGDEELSKLKLKEIENLKQIKQMKKIQGAQPASDIPTADYEIHDDKEGADSK